MNIPKCPYCNKNLMVGRIDLGGGTCPFTILHENEEDGESCGVQFDSYFRTYEQADLFFKKLAYYTEEY